MERRKFSREFKLEAVRLVRERGVAVAQAERLLQSLEPHFEEIRIELAALAEMKDSPSGTIRITAGEHPAISVLQPALRKFLLANPDVHVEIIVDYGLTDIVAERYDAGVRLGAQIARDMIAVRISPDITMAVVGAPGYLKRYPAPIRPEDLTAHNCINIRLPTLKACFPGNSKRMGRRSRSGLMDRLSSMTFPCACPQSLMELVSPICPSIRCNHMSTRVG